jgi:hypothetical protein
MTLNVKAHFATPSINDTQPNNILLSECVLFIVMLNVIMPSFVMQSVVAPFWEKGREEGEGGIDQTKHIVRLSYRCFSSTLYENI